MRPDVKEALLLSGLYADEATYVKEQIVSRDHLERMLQALDVPVSAAGPIVGLDPAPWNARIEPFSFEVPGDVAGATLLAGLAALVPGSRICVRDVGFNATRTGAFELLRQMGAAVELVVQGTRLGETHGTVCAAHAPLRAVSMAGELLQRAGDDLPVLAALAARARGTTEIVGIDELAKIDAFAERGASAEAMVISCTGSSEIQRPTSPTCPWQSGGPAGPSSL
jgi:3-phosphoshikimate 1-carboxyvinyltransferase